MKKNICILVMLFIVCLSKYNNSVYAQPENYVKNAILVENGISREITENELLEFKKESIKENNIIESELVSNTLDSDNDIVPYDTAFSDTYKFNISVSNKYIDYVKQQAVTPIHGGGGTISYGKSASFSASFSISLSTNALQKVKSTVGGSFSATSNKSFGMTFNVPAGKKGRVMFAPMTKKSGGILTTYSGVTGKEKNKKYLTVYQPVKVNSFADGLYYLMEVS